MYKVVSIILYCFLLYLMNKALRHKPDPIAKSPVLMS